VWLHDHRYALSRHEAHRFERKLDHEPGDHHGSIRGRKEEEHHPNAVVLAVDVQDRHHDQIREDERDDAAEADAAIPQHGSQRHVPDRAHEREHGDDRSH